MTILVTASIFLNSVLEILGDTSPSSTAFLHYPQASRLAERVAQNIEDVRNSL